MTSNRPSKKSEVKKFIQSNFERLYINPLKQRVYHYPQDIFSKVFSNGGFDENADAFGLTGIYISNNTKFHPYEDKDYTGYKFSTPFATGQEILAIKRNVK